MIEREENLHSQKETVAQEPMVSNAVIWMLTLALNKSPAVPFKSMLSQKFL